MKGKALRRALQTDQAYRIDSDVPLITDTTELITPEKAHEYLQQNKNNRPTNWNKVEEYTEIMEAGQWQLHPQGIIWDCEGNLVNGQNRLWAVIYSGQSVYMRVSRGTKPESAKVIDRGAPQSARDLASRNTGKRHSPIEASISRGVLALKGHPRPEKDVLAEEIEKQSELVASVFEIIKGTKKTKAVIMVLAAICFEADDIGSAKALAKRLASFVGKLEENLKPLMAAQCWNKGAAFILAMEKAREIIHREKHLSSAL